MPLYEHVFIARQDLSNAQAEGLVEHFSTVLSDNGGSVVNSEYWGVKTMAYVSGKCFDILDWTSMVVYD